MSGIAEILINQGFEVSGSDLRLTEVTKRLEEIGAKVYEGHSSENVKDVDVLVYSSAVIPDNPEVRAAADRNIPIIKRAEMLAETMRMQYGIGIAGTHGKTTTTSMVGLTLTEGGIDPTIIVGGKLSGLGGTNARLGNGEFIVVEADEFDRTFLKLTPTIAAITTLEREHLDTYRDLDDIKTAFIEFANKVPFYGFVVICLDEPALQDIIPFINKTIFTYGTTAQADVRAIDIEYEGFSSHYKVMYKGKELGRIKLNIPGEHYVKNSLVAVTIGMELGIDFEVIKKALEKFTGVYRRFETKYKNDILVLDDYAHHPTETSATLAGIRAAWDRRLVVVFQPHLYSRTRDFAADFAAALSQLDELILLDIYPARELPIEGVDSDLILRDVKLENKTLCSKENLLPLLMEKDLDVLVTFGAGDIDKMVPLIKEQLKKMSI